MKKILLTAGICVATLCCAYAQLAIPQSVSGSEQKVSQELSGIISACHLTPAQAAKAKPIVEETMKDREANEKQYSSDKRKLKAANEATLKTEVAKLGGILNADQKSQLKAFEKQEMAKMGAKAHSLIK